MKGGSDLIEGGDGTEVPSMEIVQLPNKKVDVVRGDRCQATLPELPMRMRDSLSPTSPTSYCW